MNILPYAFANFSLTPAAFASVAQTVAAGQTLRRSDLVEMVLAHHYENGGGQMTTNPAAVAKKALSLMVSDGLASPTSMYGIWQIFGEADPDREIPAAVAAAAAKESIPEYIYAYYLPAYKALAESRGESRWPHKIGLTTLSVEARIASQIGTALPERPIIIRVVETDNCYLLEKAIHAVLELKGMKINDAPGNEWFNTNSEDIESIIQMCE